MANFIPILRYPAVSPTVTITFDLPPADDPLSENIISNFKDSTATDGTRQRLHFYNEEKITIKWVFLTKTLLDLLRTFFEDHGSLGKEFGYSIHSDVPSYTTYTLDSKNFNPKRNIPDGSDDFIYDLTLRFRRVK